MKIAWCSESKGYKWNRGCTEIKYRKTNIPESGKKFYYALSFTFDFQTVNDKIYFAYSYPYTFSMLDKFLFKLS